MNVQTIIDQLSQLDPNLPVLMSGAFGVELVCTGVKLDKALAPKDSYFFGNPKDEDIDIDGGRWVDLVDVAKFEFGLVSVKNGVVENETITE